MEDCDEGDITDASRRRSVQTDGWVTSSLRTSRSIPSGVETGPLGEELGWRGFALPRLLPRYGAARASLVLGVIWTFWHLPMMLWSPGASIPSFMGLSAFAIAVYPVQITSETVLMTWLFLRTQGNLLLAVLAHLTFNTAEAVVYGGLPEPAVEQERAVYLVNVALLAAIALAVLWRLAMRRHAPAGRHPRSPDYGTIDSPDLSGQSNRCVTPMYHCT